MAGVALLPLLLLLGSLLGALVEDNRGTMIGDVLTFWNLVGIFGFVVYVPVMAISLSGALLLPRKFRLGRWLASIGSVAMVFVAAALVFAGIADVVAPPEHRDPDSWAGPLSPFGTAVFVAPYVAMLAANVVVLVRLWKRTKRPA
ncbi:hypothetical protein [Rhodococcus sp. NPDC127528]|uniref:hypothetical protein n=1 Tax=unclassified Rhodococcus (in: high G+C Gram-positive bacteria) TaxID=192944 RepID=UPI00362D4660